MEGEWILVESSGSSRCNYNPSFYSEYYVHSLNVLETALSRVPAYKSWRSFDPGKCKSVDIRYASMPVLTKRDIQNHSPQDFMPEDHEISSGLINKKIELVKTSGTIDESVTNIWNYLRSCLDI